MTQERRMFDVNLHEYQLEEELRLQSIETNIKTLETKIDLLAANVDGLVSAWKAASWLVSAVKWISATALAVTAILSIIKGIK